MLILKTYSESLYARSLRFNYKKALFVFRFPIQYCNNKEFILKLCNFIENDLSTNIYYIKNERNTYYINSICDNLQFVDKNVFLKNERVNKSLYRKELKKSISL